MDPYQIDQPYRLLRWEGFGEPGGGNFSSVKIACLRPGIGEATPPGSGETGARGRSKRSQIPREGRKRSKRTQGPLVPPVGNRRTKPRIGKICGLSGAAGRRGATRWLEGRTTERSHWENRRILLIETAARILSTIRSARWRNDDQAGERSERSQCEYECIMPKRSTARNETMNWDPGVEP